MNVILILLKAVRQVPEKMSHVLLLRQSYRRGSTVFAGKHGFITLRDLFRWGERYRLAEQLEKDYDWLQHLANDGELCYFLQVFLKCLCRIAF